MKTIIINLSPRTNGTCVMLSNYFKERLEAHKREDRVVTANLYQHLKDMQKLLEDIKASETIVLIGPCYIDTYPADTIYLLEQMSATEGVLHGQKLYGFIQGGMPYVHTHESGLKLLDNFADENAVTWMGGFVMGGGAVLNGRSIDQAIGAKKLVPAIDTFVEHIAKGESSPDELYKNAALKVPFLLAWIMSHVLSNMIKKQYREKGINYKAPSPYLD